MSINKGIHNGTEMLIKATGDGELQVRAIVESEVEHASASGFAFSFPSNNTDIDAGDTRLFIKNTGDKFLILERIIFGPSNVVCEWELGTGSETTTPTGTSIGAVNMNQRFTNASESYIAYDDETAVADSNAMLYFTSNTTESLQAPIDGVILGKNHYVQVRQMTESTSGRATIIGHFEAEVV